MEIKKLFVIAAVVLCSVSSFGQKAPGTVTLYPRVGLNLSEFSGDALYYNSEYYPADGKAHARYKAGFVAGAEVQYQLDRVIALSGGVLYSEQGTKFEKIPLIGEQPKLEHNNVVFPLLVMATSPYGFSVKIGLQPEVRVSDKYKNVMNNFNLSVPVGLSYEYRNVCLDVRYCYGLTHIYKDSGPYDKSHNSTFMFTLGYGIDL